MKLFKNKRNAGDRHAGRKLDKRTRRDENKKNRRQGKLDRKNAKWAGKKGVVEAGGGVGNALSNVADSVASVFGGGKNSQEQPMIALPTNNPEPQIMKQDLGIGEDTEQGKSKMIMIVGGVLPFIISSFLA